MHCFCTILVLLLFTAMVAAAQTTRSDSTYLGSYTAKLTQPVLAIQKNHGALATGTDLVISVSVLRVGAIVEIHLNLEGTHFTTDEGWDAMSTPALFDLMGQTAVAQVLAQGLLDCPSECAELLPTTRFIAPSCVVRKGEGAGTHFKFCGLPGICVREYVVCCAQGTATPTITMVNSFQLPNGLCGFGGGSCESTCP